MLTVETLSKSFGDTAVLEDLKFHIKSGQFYALIGKNGAGKSTLMKILAGQEMPDTGKGQIDGRILFAADSPSNSVFAFISTEQVCTASITIQEWANYFSKTFVQWDQELFSGLKQRFGIEPSRTYGELSQGQKIRALFALQAARRPKLYLLDEISGVLDAYARFCLLEFLKSEVQRGASVVMSTNLAFELEGFADHILLLQNKKIFLDSSVADLNQHYIKVRKVAEGSHPLFQHLGIRKIRVNADGSASYLAWRKSFNAEAPDELMDRRAVGIEDIFIYHTGEQE